MSDRPRPLEWHAGVGEVRSGHAQSHQCKHAYVVERATCAPTGQTSQHSWLPWGLFLLRVSIDVFGPRVRRRPELGTFHGVAGCRGAATFGSADGRREPGAVDVAGSPGAPAHTCATPTDRPRQFGGLQRPHRHAHLGAAAQAHRLWVVPVRDEVADARRGRRLAVPGPGGVPGPARAADVGTGHVRFRLFGVFGRDGRCAIFRDRQQGFRRSHAGGRNLRPRLDGPRSANRPVHAHPLIALP
mmetsp:Transcript_18554/g.55425  ORF Transcript_18554/g.55425 Transcript_18554/m.55425 type:complete len:243 (-) Transcript_18554:109-837(-)